MIAFATAFNYFFIVITNYGFHLSATHDVSINRNNRQKLSEIFSSVMLIKILFMIFSLIILFTFVFTIPKFSKDFDLLLVMFLTVAGNVFFPRWYLLGTEQVNVITLTSISGKLITIIPIFFYVKNTTDYLLAAVFLASSEIISGILALFLILYKNQIKSIIPGFLLLKNALKEGFHIFISQVAVTGVTGTNLFILGIFSEPKTIGCFALAEKIIKSAIGLIAPISDAIYPGAGLLFNKSRTDGLYFLKKVIKISGSIFFCGSCCLFFGAELIVFLIAGKSIYQTALLLKIMAFIPLTVFMDNIYGTQILLNIYKKKEFMNIIIISGIFSVICALVFIPFFHAYACACIFLISELLILLLMMFEVYRSKISPFTFRVISEN